MCWPEVHDKDSEAGSLLLKTRSDLHQIGRRESEAVRLSANEGVALTDGPHNLLQRLSALH